MFCWFSDAVPADVSSCVQCSMSSKYYFITDVMAMIAEPWAQRCCSTINKITETEINIQPEGQRSKIVNH